MVTAPSRLGVLLLQCVGLIQGGRLGFCSMAADEGGCVAGSKGSWKARANGITSMAGCADRCLRCARCSCISFSRPLDNCSWFDSCDVHSLRTEGVEGGLSFRSACIKRRPQNVSWPLAELPPVIEAHDSTEPRLLSVASAHGRQPIGGSEQQHGKQAQQGWGLRRKAEAAAGVASEAMARVRSGASSDSPANGSGCVPPPPVTLDTPSTMAACLALVVRQVQYPPAVAYPGFCGITDENEPGDCVQVLQ